MQARRSLENEINIVAIVQSIRFFTAALEELLSPDQISRLKEQRQFHLVDPDDAGEVADEREVNGNDPDDDSKHIGSSRAAGGGEGRGRASSFNELILQVRSENSIQLS